MTRIPMLRLRIILLLSCTMCLAMPTFGFSTYAAIGGRIHREITTKGLKGISMTSHAKLKIIEGNGDQDSWFHHKDWMLDEARHFDSCKLTETTAFIEKCYAEINAEAPHALANLDSRIKILYLFGNLLHPVQDFYSHSNYLEHSLKANSQLTPEQVQLVKWHNISNESTLASNGNIRTGYFYYKSLTDYEASHPRDFCIAYLTGTTPKQILDNTHYVPDSEYYTYTSFTQRLNFATDPNHSFLHRDLNKDNPPSDEGKVKVPSTGITLHEYAKNLAIRETREQWKRLERELRTTLGSAQGDLLIQRLKLTNIP